ncbi:MAG: 3-hydroxybutyryl-CoA dehydrogenase, partial [Acidobacteriota bacterium]|nr:3-hydroxybutyryl-CoA dehydrogenase [Acidobacteriota bacterium]
GIVGCGLMGAGIAQCAAEAGFEVRVKEVEQAFLDKGLGRIQAGWDRAVAKGKLQESQKAEYAQRLRGTLDLASLGDCDLVIEAVPERLDLKLATLGDLDRTLDPSALICSNTSSLSLAQLGTALDPGRLPRLAGLHFFNPVPAMPLVEIVRALGTSEATVAALKEFVARLGKTAVLAPDAPGFVVNRLLVPYLLDAIRCAEQRLASVDDLDAAMKLGAGHPMGPLHLSDFIGLDTMASVADVFFEAFGEPRFKAPALLRQLVAAGRLGRKSGSGFYRWEGDKRMEALPL